MRRMVFNEYDDTVAVAGVVLFVMIQIILEMLLIETNLGLTFLLNLLVLLTSFNLTLLLQEQALPFLK